MMGPSMPLTLNLQIKSLFESRLGLRLTDLEGKAHQFAPHDSIPIYRVVLGKR